jgi:GT2 family glycosyltransferase/glycosyltransferase involved in cell wall biosynthesis
MTAQVKVAFASGPDDLNPKLIERIQALYPELPLYVVAEFPPDAGQWIPYHLRRTIRENLEQCRAALAGKRIRLAGVLLVPNMPYRRMRLVALLLSPIGFLAFNEHLDSFMLRPRCAATIVRHLWWRTKNFLRWQKRRNWRRDAAYALAMAAGWLAALQKSVTRPPEPAAPSSAAPDGISVVIPSRNGSELLARLLPGLFRELAGFPSEVIVVDNGSDEYWEHPGVTVERSAEPLSFARAVNRGIRRARYRYVCLLNNDMVLEPGFFSPLRDAFDRVPDLFCATAQILFPEGVRREETGKANYGQDAPTDFPVRCDLPIAGENLSFVLYGSGGCSLYDAGMLAALGNVDEAYQPAYVEDLDLGYRAWRRGWPTVFVADARVEHRHRATTSRYFSPAELEYVLETNYLRFLCRAVASPVVFRRLWRQAIDRLNLLHAARALAFARQAQRLVEHSAGGQDEERILAIGSGAVAVFPGRGPRHGHGDTVLIASPYLPFPLSHGGAVRIYNLMRQAARHRDLVLVAFTGNLETPPAELLDLCAEIVLVRRTGSHALPSTARPEVVEEFDSPAFHAALRLTVRKWRPGIVQLEFTQMAQYAADCAPAKTILVEHDITLDLYEQLAATSPDWETSRQLARWRDFETRAWLDVDRVVTMSAKDSVRVTGALAVALPNGVDLDRFRPAGGDAEPGRLLFIGSFAHRPNVMAVEYFLREVWPRLGGALPVLHIIAGARHESFPVAAPLDQPGIEVEGFVSDVRPAYARAQVVIAPLVASAGTNIKILEAMAMGKAIVSTPAGVNGLDVLGGEDVVIASDPQAMAEAILELLRDPARRHGLEQRARCTAERHYGWEAIGSRQERLYREVGGEGRR